MVTEKQHGRNYQHSLLLLEDGVAVVADDSLWINAVIISSVKTTLKL